VGQPTGFGLFSVLLTGEGRKRSRRRLAILLAIFAIVAVLALVGCGGSSSNTNNGGGGGGGGGGGTPAGTYTINVTGSDSTGLKHVVAVKLTVS